MCPRAKRRERATSQSTPTKLWILLVGVNQYYDRRNLPSLQYSAVDCQGLGSALKEATASFSNKEVIIHHDFASQHPHQAEVRQSIQHIVSAACPGDTILFYFSGHGILDPKTQQVVLCLADTDTKQLLTTGIPLNPLLKQLSNCAATQQLVWLDACHSGGMTLLGTSKISLPNPSSRLVEVLRHQAAESKGFYALLSCDRTQQSWEFPELGHGVFTYYLMRGLRGEAADSQGIIEADALYQYVYHQTLQYIDQTNQQIRLINQQKSSKGETKLQAEFPLQTPKRIVEGFGKVVLGVRKSYGSQEVNPRQALVIDGGLKGNRTTLALSKLLQSAGKFDLRYFPQTNEPWSRVKQAIATCLNSQGNTSDPEITTALLYLRGQIEPTDTGESWLVLQDGMRLSRSWLRKVLRDSRAVRQIVILDCPGENSLTDWVEDLQLSTERGQCLIAANAPVANSQQFTEAVLETLQNADSKGGLPIAAWITQLQIALAGKIIPQVWLSGTQGVIEILTAKNGVEEDRQPVLDLGICPYMGLQAFKVDSAEYFYGREALVQRLLNQINHQSSLAVVGASGSGKSSAIQAGLIAQLRQGKQIPQSDRWCVSYVRPGSKPVRALAKSLVISEGEEALQVEGLLYQGVEGFVYWLRARPEPMVLLIVDQFEELFTLAGESERQEFLKLILGAIKYAGDRFKFILSIRADFVASCLEIAELADILQTNSVLVPPYLTAADYRSAIAKPAEQVGLEVESGLVELLLQDLDRSAGNLPLLQFALQQLWERRENGKLTLKAYQQLGGIKGALERQAQAVYDSLDSETQACVRWIFLNLTQLGEGTEDTRRRITKSDLVVAKYPEAKVNQTLRILTDAKLLVVDLDHVSNIGQSREANISSEGDGLCLAAMHQEATVEVVHEILIRHWSSLRWWIEENRSRLRSQRQIEQAAVLWLQKERQPDFMLRGIRLAEAEEIYTKYTDELSDTAIEFVATCIDARVAEQKATTRRLHQARLTATALGILGLAASAFGVTAYRQQLITRIENIDGLNAVAEAQLLSNRQLESLTTSLKAGKQLKQLNRLAQALVGRDSWQGTKAKTTATLQQSIYGTQELNRLEGHSQKVNAVSVSDDGELFATAGDDRTVKIWQKDGSLIETLPKKATKVNLAFDLDGTKRQINNPLDVEPKNIATNQDADLVAVDDEGMVQLRSPSGNSLVTYPHPEPVNSVNISPDGKLVATATLEGIYIWSRDGILQQNLKGHTGEVTDVEFIQEQPSDYPSGLSSNEGTLSDRYKLISTGVDKTVRIWQVFARYTNNESIYTVAANPTSNTFATAGSDGEIKVWRNQLNGTPELIRTLSGHQDTVSQIKYSPDGQLMASASWDKTIKLWDRSTGKLIDTLKHEQGVNTIAFSSDSQILVTGSEDTTVKLWSLDNKPELIKTLTGHTDSIKAVTVSPDGQLIASAGYDNTIKLWNITGELLQTIDAHNLAITSLAFTPDSKTLASGSWDNTIKLWQIEDAGTTSQLSHTLIGHQDGITTLSFNSNGTVLATGSGDRLIKLWHPQTGELIKNLRGHTSQINSLAFGREDRSMVSAEEQQGLFQWNLDLDHLLTQGCDRLSDYLATNPNLKPSEQKLCQ
ncbi:caspase family protein [Pleurocapsales cyanobacterium LEGE 10410]|nr:caspase family protein [Pleurocapsales cyanobacterium LEGE 10410]